MSEQTRRGRNNELPSGTLKALIISHAKNGTFNRNPLLNTSHALTCPHCQHRQRIVYLDSLKKGDFELGKAEQIEVLDASGPMGVWEKEQVTPLIISHLCEGCNDSIEVCPISVEYLQLIINTPPVSSAIYG